MNILITGGCGYKGTELSEQLAIKHNISVIDTQWFGNFIKNPKINIIKQDIRELDSKYLKNIDTVIHLANIANDPGVDLNPVLSWEVNVLASQKLIENCIKNKVKNFIFASSGSVYGVKEEPEVTEDLDLVPISTYNKTKMTAERVMLSYKDDINIHIIRPATVCGYSRRMRLDVSVNMFVFQALMNKKMTIFGGSQVRPNIHIKDINNVYEYFIENPSIKYGIYNAGFENLSLLEIADKIKSIIGNDIEIIITKSNDIRSYRLNSDKLLSTGFQKKYNVDIAINDIITKFENNELKDSDEFYTVKWMKKLKLDEIS